MAIRDEKIKLNWKGEDYDLLLDYDVIKEIDNEVGILRLIEEAQKTPLKLTIVSDVIYVLLNLVGVELSKREALGALFGSGDMDQSKAQALIEALLAGIIGNPKKKPTGQSGKKKATRKKSAKTT